MGRASTGPTGSLAPNFGACRIASAQRSIVGAFQGAEIPDDLLPVVRERPKNRIMAQLIRELKGLPDHAVLRIVREVRDGDW